MQEDLRTRYVGLTVAAHILGLSQSTVRLLADSGRVRSTRDPVGRRLLLREDVERIADERKHSRALVSG